MRKKKKNRKTNLTERQQVQSEKLLVRVRDRVNRKSQVSAAPRADDRLPTANVSDHDDAANVPPTTFSPRLDQVQV